MDHLSGGASALSHGWVTRTACPMLNLMGRRAMVRACKTSAHAVMRGMLTVCCELYSSNRTWQVKNFKGAIEHQINSDVVLVAISLPLGALEAVHPVLLCQTCPSHLPIRGTDISRDIYV